MATFLLNGYAMAYDVTGAGIPLVFIHEAGTDRRLWHQQRVSLPSCYRLIMVDVLGHGEQAWPLDELSIERAALHIQRLLERLDTQAAFIVGVSMGAAVAMRLALNAPAMVRGLILLNPWTHVSGHTKDLIERLFRLADAGDMVGHTELFLRYIFPPAYLERWATEVEHLRTMTMEQNAKAVAYAWAACLSANVTAEVGAIVAPTLVCAGLQDLLTPPYLAREVAESLFAVELEIWSSTGHFPALEDPVRFSRRLEAFIQQVLGAGGREAGA